MDGDFLQSPWQDASVDPDPRLEEEEQDLMSDELPSLRTLVTSMAGAEAVLLPTHADAMQLDAAQEEIFLELTHVCRCVKHCLPHRHTTPLQRGPSLDGLAGARD